MNTNTTSQPHDTAESWRTPSRGNHRDEYEIYCSCAGDASGLDRLTGKPLKTFDEWLNS